MRKTVDGPPSRAIHARSRPEADEPASEPGKDGQRPSITACVIVRNGAATIEETLASLTAAADEIARILVVDDASDDDTVALVASGFPQVDVILLEVNRGPAAARNVGFAHAQTDRVLFVDSDVRLDEGCVGLLSTVLDAHPDAVMAMPRVVHAHDPERVHFQGAHSHFLGLMALDQTEGAAAGGPDDVRDLGSVVTACCLLDARRWDGGLPLDAALFYSYEDHDLGVRARLLGHRILAVPGARCFHGTGTPGLSVRGDGPSPRRRIYLNIRNRWRVMLKCYRLRTLLLLAPVLLLYELVQVAGVMKKGWLREWCRAVAWSVTNFSGTLQGRRQVQALRSVGDGELLIGGPLPIRPGVAATRLERAGLRALERVSGAYWERVRRFL